MLELDKMSKRAEKPVAPGGRLPNPPDRQIAGALPVRASSVRFTRVTGGPPPPGVSEAKADLGATRGDEFRKACIWVTGPGHVC